MNYKDYAMTINGKVNFKGDRCECKKKAKQAAKMFKNSSIAIYIAPKSKIGDFLR